MSTKQTSAATSFAYWVPNVSGGLITSTIEQKTSWDLDYNIRLAQTAEANGFDYALSQVRYLSSYGAEFQHEPTAISLALLLATKRLKVITAVLPGAWNPAVLAKIGATIDQFSQGRWAINIVSGWFKQEFTALGIPWLEHDERYRQSEEFILALREIWQSDQANFAGDFYRVRNYNLQPKPLALPERPYPEIFQGGASHAAKAMAGRVIDVYFSNGKSLEDTASEIQSLRQAAEPHGREIRFGLNAFIIARDSEKEAHDTLKEIIAKADDPAVKGFREAVKQAGQSSKEGQGMWANSSYNDLIQYNDGFKTGLIGTPEQIAERINDLRKIGVDIILGGFLHFQDDIEYFGKKVLPLVRQLEQQDRDQAVAQGIAS